MSNLSGSQARLSVSPNAGNEKRKPISPRDTPSKRQFPSSLESNSEKQIKTSKSTATTPVVSPATKIKTPPELFGPKKTARSMETTPKSKSPRRGCRPRGRKRKRRSSESSDDDLDDLPENAEEVDRKLQETAAKNNMSQDSVKKILKKVVTNDHVLALVALREEEEVAAHERSEPKITRAKAKELTKTSPDSTAPWNLELTPIKHIPVKTRPEVTALIAHDLPDESDEEYHPNHDDVLSDDDHTLESCSDLDSQPRTPATPASAPPASPQPSPIVTDGPFKVPTVRSFGKRVPEEDEEATIALRTRSKLCLSSTPIESIEQSFVPPDEVPPPCDVDHLWSNFLNEVLDPNRTSFRNEDDDDADPEYNVAADQDVYDDDEETLERSLVNISRKELDDLFNELMGMSSAVPDSIPVKIQPMEIEEESCENSEANYLDLDNQHRLGQNNMVEMPRVPIPVKEEPPDDEVPGDHEALEIDEDPEPQPPVILRRSVQSQKKSDVREIINIVVSNENNKITEEVTYQEAAVVMEEPTPPRLLRNHMVPVPKPVPQKINIVLNGDGNNVIEPAQIAILEQQLRQHIQLATSSYLQIYIHPRHWNYAPAYKDYVVSLNNMADERAKLGQRSVVEVCNLRAALALITSWEETLSQDTPENQAIIKFLEDEAEKCIKRNAQNVMYNGSFHPLYMEVISNSSVFVYPYMLPPLPFRSDTYRRQMYLHSEDCLIALGLEQFYHHIHRNRNEFKQRKGEVCWTRVGELVVKHMLPWLRPRALMYHVSVARKHRAADHPIRRFFETKKVDPVQHRLLAFNPNITLHEQPQYEVPLQWVRYLSKQNKRAKDFVMKRAKLAGHEPESVTVDIENKEPTSAPMKQPLPITQTKQAIENLKSINLSISPLNEQNPSITLSIKTAEPIDKDGISKARKMKNNAPKRLNNANITPAPYSIIQTQDGGFLVPVVLMPPSSNSTSSLPLVNTEASENTTITPLNIDECSNMTISSTIYHDNSNEIVDTPAPPVTRAHCRCCELMTGYRKRWSLITNYFSRRKHKENFNCCVDNTWPKISQRLKYLLASFKSSSKHLNSANDYLDTRLIDQFSEVPCATNHVTVSKDMLNKLSDQIWANTFMSKLALSNLRNGATSRNIVNMIDKFNIVKDNPIDLFKKLSSLLEDEYMSTELVGILTAAQADQIGRYTSYFIIRHLQQLKTLIQEEIKDDTKQKRLLEQISLTLSTHRGRACDLCCHLLSPVRTSRRLSEFVFSVTCHVATPGNVATAAYETDRDSDHTTVTLMNGVHDGSSAAVLTSPRNESNESISDDNIKTNEILESSREITTTVSSDKIVDQSYERTVVKTNEHEEPDAPSWLRIARLHTPVPREMELDTPELSVSKTEVEGTDSRSSIKLEPIEWSRDEDKILLQAIQTHAPPSDTLHADIMQVLQQKDVYRTLSDDLNDKSDEQVRGRIRYLLQFLCDASI